VHGLDGIERNEEVASILDIDHHFGSALRRNLANGAEGVLPVGKEHLEPFLDLLAHLRLRSFAAGWQCGIAV
jgi:hypothetical protein